MFSAIVVTRSILRVVVRQEWARKASLFGLRDDEFIAPWPATPDRADRCAPMFDVIGKRRFFYLFSADRHDPGPVLHPAHAVQRRRPAVHHRLHRRHALGDPVRGSGRDARPGRAASSPTTAWRRRSCARAPASSRSRPSRSGSQPPPTPTPEPSPSASPAPSGSAGTLGVSRPRRRLRLPDPSASPGTVRVR